MAYANTKSHNEITKSVEINRHSGYKDSVLRSKGLKDATCVGWFGDDWDCSVGSPPEAIDHVSSSVPFGYAV